MTDPQPPSQAYKVMALVLPTGFLEKNLPPKAGSRLFVTGADGIKTQWDLPSNIAPAVASGAMNRGCRVVALAYKDAAV